MLEARRQLLTVTAVLVATIIVGCLVVRSRAANVHTRPAPVLGVGAYFHGGTPARDPELEAWLLENLTQLVIETDADRMGSREGAPRARRVSELRDAKLMTSSRSAHRRSRTSLRGSVSATTCKPTRSSTTPRTRSCSSIASRMSRS